MPAVHGDSDCCQLCDLLLSATHEAQTVRRSFSRMTGECLKGSVAEQFVVYESHLQYNEHAYALLSELVCFIFSKIVRSHTIEGLFQ